MNDIARDNRVKDRLEELKKLSLSDEGVCVSGGVDNKEGLAPWTWKVFGGGKAKVAPETPKNEETSENKSAVEERSVSSLQTREAEVQARESEVIKLVQSTSQVVRGCASFFKSCAQQATTVMTLACKAGQRPGAQHYSRQ